MNWHKKSRHGIAIVLVLSSLITTFTVADGDNTKFRRLDGLYEPSGAVQLNDGRILLIEDEAERSFSLLEPQDQSSTFGISRVQSRFLFNPAFYSIQALPISMIWRAFRIRLTVQSVPSLPIPEKVSVNGTDAAKSWSALLQKETGFLILLFGRICAKA